MNLKIRPAVEFMKMNIHRRLTPGEIAEAVGLSLSRVENLFKDESDKSPLQYHKS